TKRGLWTTGTAQLAGGISGVGMAVSKSVSGLWSSLSTGIASSILNRSLGFVDGDGSAGATSSTTSTGRPGLGDRKRSPSASASANEAGLIDAEIETLYEGFQKSRTEKEQEEGEQAVTDDEEASRIRLED